jgi:hypothetical protein
MKASFALALGILAAGGLFGWKRQQALEAAHADHRQLTEEARALGLSPESLLRSGEAPLRTKSQRDSTDKTAAAKEMVRELVGFARTMKDLQSKGEQPDEELQRRMMELMGRFMDMGPSQIKTVIDDLRASEEIDDEMRRGILGFAIMMLAEKQPEAALAIYTESSDLGLDGMGEHVLASSLGKWAEDDPLAALEWVRKHSEKHAKMISDSAKSAILAGAARQDPKLALGLIGELGVELHAAGRSLGDSARTPEEREALLAALRDEQKHQAVVDPALQALGDQLTSEGFEESGKWLDDAELTTAEAAAIARGISSWRAGADTGKWLEWMAEKNLPAEVLNEKVSDLVGQWTRTDFKAAGEWINGSAEGPMKTAAVKTYAMTVAPYEPESARQWADSLPAGRERDEVLEAISRAKPSASDPKVEELIWTDPGEE